MAIQQRNFAISVIKAVYFAYFDRQFVEPDLTAMYHRNYQDLP